MATLLGQGARGNLLLGGPVPAKRLQVRALQSEQTTQLQVLAASSPPVPTGGIGLPRDARMFPVRNERGGRER